VTVAFLPPSSAEAAGIQALFNLNVPSDGPFPSDRFTIPDDSQNTWLRVNLPKPDCAVQVSDCQDLDVIDTLDGFNLQPRLSIPFSGPIDVETVRSDTVFLVSLGSALPGGASAGQKVGINQVVWDIESSTLHVESDELLDQHTRYVLIVTRGVRDAAGDPVESSEAFRRFRHDLNFGQTRDNAPDLRERLKAYRNELLLGLEQAVEAGIDEADIVVASVFTTQSATAVLEKIRDQIKADTP